MNKVSLRMAFREGMIYRYFRIKNRKMKIINTTQNELAL